MQDFAMSIPKREEIQQEVATLVKPDDTVTKEVRDRAEKNVTAIMNLDLDSLEAKNGVVSMIDGFGMGSIRYSNEKNNLLSVSIEKLSQEGNEGSTVSKGLISLQNQMQELNPNGLDFTKQGILGKLFNPMRAYFNKYKKAETVISDTLKALDNGKAILERDNKTLLMEQHSLREITKQILSEIDLAMAMKDSLEKQVEEAKLRGEDQYKIDFITQEVLFPLTQRVGDLQTMAVVNQQGIMSTELTARTNKELIRGVDRAKMVTVSALRNAVMVAGALYNQKLVLNAIDGLNQTTADMISATSNMLKTQGVQVQQQAMSSMLPVETLKQSFQDLFDAMDSITTFKEQALPEMSRNILEFKEMLADGEKTIAKMEKGSALSL